jgi:hypothetical protein
MIRLLLISIIVLAMVINCSAQKALVFSAIKGTESKPASASLSAVKSSVKLTGTDMRSFRIISHSNGKLVVAFIPASDFTGIKKASIEERNAAGKLVSVVNVTGLSTNGLEGENEAPLSQIIEALGYKANIGWTTLANHVRPDLQGEEIPYSLFHKAAKGVVQIIPVARYSPDFELTYGYYTDSAVSPNKIPVGVLAKADKYPEHQTLFPKIVTGKTTFDPGIKQFGFYATSPSHTAWTEDVWNAFQFPANASHATRIYALKSSTDQVLPNTYLLCIEEAKNGDYNDYVFLIKNVIPVTADPFVSLFNGKDLSGWHSFLQNIGTDRDPNGNFKVEDGLLHVNGKDLGYVITNNPYANYHFKVEFRWGVNKWPPRQNDKRDAGICYNIPVNEPDSIWPKSIECQIQEGDVGDFWLLGFSTIKVKGEQNVPSEHTRFIKYADGEKPYGEWNTVEVVSINGTCIHMVNGVIVNVGTDASVKEGRILLQSEYSEIYYRNPRIRQL